ncbi:hypothetical protein [Paraburkholderia tropica]|uniref:hypothetical protein n=1 Tax=Paraburkholderia tropica TaxID=92647 RepID=UPI003D2D6D89
MIGTTALQYGRTLSHIVGWNYQLGRTASDLTALDASLSWRRTDREINNFDLDPQRVAVLRVGGNAPPDVMAKSLPAWTCASSSASVPVAVMVTSVSASTVLFVAERSPLSPILRSVVLRFALIAVARVASAASVMPDAWTTASRPASTSVPVAESGPVAASDTSSPAVTRVSCNVIAPPCAARLTSLPAWRAPPCTAMLVPAMRPTS